MVCSYIDRGLIYFIDDLQIYRDDIFLTSAAAFGLRLCVCYYNFSNLGFFL